MAATLDLDAAKLIAAQLKLIPGFWDDVMITTCAADLVRWCHGAFIDGGMWTPEKQAEWVVTEARENWDKWLGTAAFRQLFRSKFVAPIPPGNAAVDYGPKPPIDCPKCNDSGFLQSPRRYCDCPMGQYLETLWGVRALETRRPQAAQGVRSLQPFEPVTIADMQAATEKHQREKAARAQSVELPPDTPSES